MNELVNWGPRSDSTYNGNPCLANTSLHRIRAVFSALIDLIGIKCLSFISLQVTVRIFLYLTPLKDVDGGSRLAKSIAISLYGCPGTGSG
jgi:hypothetical protein